MALLRRYGAFLRLPEFYSFAFNSASCSLMNAHFVRHREQLRPLLLVERHGKAPEAVD